MSLQQLRHVLFKIHDKITGNRKQNHYADIKNRIEKHQPHQVQLKKLLNHACDTTSFYSTFAASTNLEDFPVVNKNLIKSKYKAFQSSKFKHTKNRIAATSGSTGAPFQVLQNPDKVDRNSADTLYFSEIAGYQLGNTLYYFRLWQAYENKNKLEQWLKNMVPVDVLDLKGEYIGSFIEGLKQNKSAKSWTGYASAFETICKYLYETHAKPIDCNLQSVIAISESLSPYTKQRLKHYFNVNTVSRYSNVENGIIAQQLPNTDYFIINTASYHVEVLECNSDTPAALESPGRIVVTDLYNFSMPLIRYDTGDIGTLDSVDGKLVLTTVQGRTVDTITDTQGNLVPNSLMMLVNNYHELKQCQLIQKTQNSYVLKVNIAGDFLKEQPFVADFKSYLGEDANITLEYVDEIPLLPSGKRRAMVNEMRAT